MSASPPRLWPGVAPVLRSLELALDEVTDAMVAAYGREIPAYAQMSGPQLQDVRRVSAQNLRLLLRVLRKGRPLTDRELAPLMDSARDRARRNVPLDDLLHAYRIGTMVAWEAVVREARRQSGGPDAALELVGELMRFVDHVSTAVARAYLDEQSRMTTDQEQRHQRLLALLVDGDLDGASRLAEQSGLALAEEYVVVLLGVDEPGHRAATRADDLRQRLASRSVVVARRDRAVLMLWPSDVTLAEITAMLGSPESAGPEPLVAYARGPVEGLASCLAEAEQVLGLRTGHAGVFALEDVLLDAVLAQTEGRTKELVSLISSALGEDGRLRETLAAYVKHEGSLSATAQALFVHRNTVVYRLSRIRTLTGLDPNRLQDLLLLAVALRCPT